MTAIGNLEDWFKKLPRSEQEEVIEFLYGRQAIIKGIYLGPAPGFRKVAMLKKGLYLGPSPDLSSLPSSCPQCGRSY